MNKDNALQQYEIYLKARVRPGTAKVYLDALRLWFSYLNGGEASQANAQAYMNLLIKTELSPSTVNLRGYAIQRWFKSQGAKVELDFPTSIQLGEPEYLSVTEVETIISVCRTPLERALVIVLFDTAVRISELMNLEVKDIDWGNGLLSIVRKGGRADLVNISDRGLRALREWLDKRQIETARVFGSVEYYDVWRLLRAIGRRVKLRVDLRPHLFRHSRAIQMMMGGAELHDVQQHLGHRSIATTVNIYGRFKAIDLKQRIPKW